MEENSKEQFSESGRKKYEKKYKKQQIFITHELNTSIKVSFIYFSSPFTVRLLIAVEWSFYGKRRKKSVAKERCIGVRWGTFIVL